VGACSGPGWRAGTGMIFSRAPTSTWTSTGPVSSAEIHIIGQTEKYKFILKQCSDPQQRTQKEYI